MALKQKLDEQRAASQKRIPPEKQAVMRRHIEELRTSGILNTVPKLGATAPDFTGASHDGRRVDTSQLRAQGPLVVSFFRGAW